MLDFVRPQRRREAVRQLDSRPAVFVMTGRDRGPAFALEVMLGKIDHRGECKPDIDHVHAAGKESDNQGKAQILAVGAKIMADNGLLGSQDPSQIGPIAFPIIRNPFGLISLPRSQRRSYSRNPFGAMSVSSKY